MSEDAAEGPLQALREALARQAHASSVLLPALPPGGSPSHAYLFHGPAGSGRGAVARAFAAALLADGAADPPAAASRARRGAHPDLTWVTPSGAAEMLVSDIEEPVVAAAARTPFEALRRVFVIEGAEQMNDQAANRLLKTLEEPSRFAHLILLGTRREDMLPTIVSRCQQVRFDPPAPERIAAGLTGVDELEALACARLCLGDAGLAARLASAGGRRMRESAEAYAVAAVTGRTEGRPWQALLAAASDAGAEVVGEADERLARELEMLPAKERKRAEKEAQEARRRGERRARRDMLDAGLRLAELWLRDLMFVREGAAGLILAVDRAEQLAASAPALTPGALRQAVDEVAQTRLALKLNVADELALEALAYRVGRLLAA